MGEDVRTAAKVLDEKLKNWYKGTVNDWDQKKVDSTFEYLFLLIKLIKNNEDISVRAKSRLRDTITQM